MIRRPRSSAALAALLAMAMSSPLAAQSAFPGLQALPPPAPDQQGAAINSTAPIPALPPIDDTVAFSHAERWIVPSYFADVRDQQLRASRSKKYDRELPAGLKQPPAKGDVLPAGVVEELRPLPGPLVRQLPPARPDTMRRIAGKNVLMLRASTGEVLDVLTEVIF